MEAATMTGLGRLVALLTSQGAKQLAYAPWKQQTEPTSEEAMASVVTAVTGNGLLPPANGAATPSVADARRKHGKGSDGRPTLAAQQPRHQSQRQQPPLLGQGGLAESSSNAEDLSVLPWLAMATPPAAVQGQHAADTSSPPAAVPSSLPAQAAALPPPFTPSHLSQAQAAAPQPPLTPSHQSQQAPAEQRSVVAEAPAAPSQAVEAGACQQSTGARGSSPGPEEDDCCIVCEETPKQSALIPCGHLLLCMACTKAMFPPGSHNQCPICRVEITQYLQVYRV